ncbi:hypothetical protein [Flavobacterium rhizosphaerae]|uniref:DUF3828 domain-containing protein n=1 Tax=Flavobacterium rhizosphaerae TaxID=3163298 RepID=A0ABW8YWB6_9FLAO
MKKIISVLLLLIVFISCRESSTDKPTNAENDNAGTPPETVALYFINGYVDNSNKLDEGISMTEFVDASPYVTSDFKSELKRIVQDADPESGLDADPVVDAQDYPDEFEVESFDKNTGYAVLKGRDWEAFKLSMVLKQVNQKWLVNGCGMVNIPPQQRQPRDF